MLTHTHTHILASYTRVRARASAHSQNQLLQQRTGFFLNEIACSSRVRTNQQRMACRASAAAAATTTTTTGIISVSPSRLSASAACIRVRSITGRNACVHCCKRTRDVHQTWNMLALVAAAAESHSGDWQQHRGDRSDEAEPKPARERSRSMYRTHDEFTLSSSRADRVAVGLMLACYWFCVSLLLLWPCSCCSCRRARVCRSALGRSEGINSSTSAPTAIFIAKHLNS